MSDVSEIQYSDKVLCSSQTMLPLVSDLSFNWKTPVPAVNCLMANKAEVPDPNLGHHDV